QPVPGPRLAAPPPAGAAPRSIAPRRAPGAGLRKAQSNAVRPAQKPGRRAARKAEERPARGTGHPAAARRGMQAGWRRSLDRGGPGEARERSGGIPAHSRAERAPHPAPEAAVLLAVFAGLRGRRALELREPPEQGLLFSRQLG